MLKIDREKERKRDVCKYSLTDEEKESNVIGKCWEKSLTALQVTLTVTASHRDCQRLHSSHTRHYTRMKLKKKNPREYNTVIL